MRETPPLRTGYLLVNTRCKLIPSHHSARARSQGKETPLVVAAHRVQCCTRARISQRDLRRRSIFTRYRNANAITRGHIPMTRKSAVSRKRVPTKRREQHNRAEWNLNFRAAASANDARSGAMGVGTICKTEDGRLRASADCRRGDNARGRERNRAGQSSRSCRKLVFPRRNLSRSTREALFFSPARSLRLRFSSAHFRARTPERNVGGSWRQCAM